MKKSSFIFVFLIVVALGYVVISQLRASGSDIFGSAKGSSIEVKAEQFLAEQYAFRTPPIAGKAVCSVHAYGEDETAMYAYVKCQRIARDEEFGELFIATELNDPVVFTKDASNADFSMYERATTDCPNCNGTRVEDVFPEQYYNDYVASIDAVYENLKEKNLDKMLKDVPMTDELRLMVGEQ